VTQVLLFAQAREAAGARHVEVEGATVAEVLAAADEQLGKAFARMRLACMIVVDDEVVPREAFATRRPGAELAVLPPVSGGSGVTHAPACTPVDGGAVPDDLR
jgi:molybdopterin synthase sulfur carrier subunit